jgi:hypothetical protein
MRRAAPHYDDPVSSAQRHTVVIYRASERADAMLAELAQRAADGADRLTVLVLAVEEPTSKGCCDTRSVLWNEVQRRFAQDELARARIAANGCARVEFAVVTHNGRRAASVVADEARRRGADEIVLADSRSSGLTRRQRRRLRADSVVPLVG